MSKVIVFGPTGNVGSVAALTAQKHGAKVILAMRDTQKDIPGLSSEDEKAGGFERVQADLTKPDTITTAVEKTGATRAFIYVAMGSKDHMRSTLSALKSAGVTFVVLLSSYTVAGDLTEYVPSQMIPFVHAQVELSLNEVFGEENYVAVRPGGFVTNILRQKKGIIAGDVRIFGGAHKFDCITPGDMGRVAGTILVQGSKQGQRKVYVYGPELIPQKNIIKQIGEVLGKEIKVTEIDREEGAEQFAKDGLPKPVIDYMLKMLSEEKEGTKDTDKYPAKYEEGVKNVELYTGRSSTGLKEWVGENKQLFSA